MASQVKTEEDTTNYPERPPNHSASPPFGVITDLFERLMKERKLQNRMKLLNAWINRWRQNVGHDLYPALRLLLPQKDRERTVYYVKQASLVKAYLEVLGLDAKSGAGKALVDWKKPTAEGKAAGDFPTVLYEVINSRSSIVTGSLSVDDVNELLDDLSKSGSKLAEQIRILRKLNNGATPSEQRWIMRIILKDLIISVKEGTVFSVFHPDAQAVFNSSSDLKRVCYELWNPDHRLDDGDKEIHIFRPFAPMLCKRPTKRIHLAMKEAVSNMGGKEFIIEEKLDGERMQLHKRGNEYFYCSRKGKDYTYLYGGHIGTGSLTPHIDDAFDNRVHDLILDGEMLVWDPVAEQYLPFGTLKTAAGGKKIKNVEDPRPCFKVFDLLYLNGKSLLKKSLTFRKKNLRTVFTEVKGRIEFTTQYMGKTTEDVKKRLDDVLESRGEGLVLKHPQSQYVLNGRLNDWTKVKPEYMEDMGETVDLLVVSGNWGTGKRGGGVSTLVCALRDDRVSNSDDVKYSSFVRIGTGLSFTDYVWIRDKPWHPFDRNDPPDFYQTAPKGSEDKGDVYLNPSDSFIIKIKAAEITPSDQYHLGFTMRFPRALHIRDDLTVDDCMTVTELMERLQAGRKRKIDEREEGSAKKRKTAKKTAVLISQGADASGVSVKTNLFDGRMFLIVQDAKMTGQEKNDLEISIVQHGGNFRQMVPRDGSLITVVFGGDQTVAALTPHVKARRSIVRPQWLRDCITAQKLVAMRGKKYVFREEHQEEDDSMTEDEDDMNLIKEEIQAEKASDTKMVMGEGDDDDEKKDDDSESVVKVEDSQYSEWFKVDEKEAETQSRFDNVKDDSDTETEGASDEDDYSWIKPEDSEPQLSRSLSQLDVDEGPKMGERDSDREYDTELIFGHLVFYLDTSDNARRNVMKANAKHQEDMSFVVAQKDIERYGGRVTDKLDEPKLTHILVDGRDKSRVSELRKRTALPKLRRLVVLSFVECCIAENTLLDEADYLP